MKLQRVLIFAFFSCVSAFSQGQTYPDHPVRLIVPSGPAGGNDFVARAIAPTLAKYLKQPVVIENRSGAGTLIGTKAALQAPADGYTLVMGGVSNMVFNAALFKPAPYDPPTDFVPVGLAVKYPYIALATNGLAFTSLRDIVEYARANPNKLNFAVIGTGSGQHVLAATLAKMANIKITIVPYKDAASVYSDLISGRVDMFIDTAPSARPQVDSGRVKAVVSFSDSRSAAYPALPVAREVGFPDLVLDSWYGVFVRRDTPPHALEQLRAALTTVMKDKEVRATFTASGAEFFQLDQAATLKYLDAEFKKWTAQIRESGIPVESAPR